MPPVPLLNRRSLLRGAGALVGAASVSGCSGLPSSSTGSSDSSYTNWLFDPADGTVSVSFTATKYDDLLAIEGVSEADFSEVSGGLPVASIDRRVVINAGGPSTRIYDGSLEMDDVRSTYDLSESGAYEPAEEYRGFDRYRYDDSAMGIAFRDGTVLFGVFSQIERSIDAYEGDGERLVDAHEQAATVTDRLEGTHSVSSTVALDPGASTLLPDYKLARGSGVTDGSDRRSVKLIVVFDDVETTSEAAVRDDVPDEPDIRDVQVETDGRVVVATYTRDRM